MAKDKIEDALGAQDEMPEGGKPLEEMDQVSDATPDKKKSEDKSLDSDVVTEMMKTGDNLEGMFTPDEEEQFEEEDKDAKVKVGKSAKPSDKYKNQFKDDMLKNPNDYKVKTPRGEMTIAEAIRKGYNPITKRFEKGHDQDEIKNKHLSALNDADRGALEQLTNPANAQVAPADAEKYGLQPGSPMIRPDQQANPMPGANPMMPPAAAPAPMGMPEGGAMPGAEESQAAGGMDLSALLGGKQ